MSAFVQSLQSGAKLFVMLSLRLTWLLVTTLDIIKDIFVKLRMTSLIGGKYLGFNDAELNSKQDLIARIREKQLTKCRTSPECYDQSDVDYLTDSDRLIRRALLVKKDESEAVAYLDETLRWRKSIGLSTIQITDFPSEFWLVGGSTIVEDYDGDPVYWVRAKTGRRIPEFQAVAKKAISLFLDKWLKQGRGQFTLVADVQDFSVQNLNWPMARFVVTELMRHFPGVVKVAVFVNLPAVVRPILYTFGRMMTIGPKIVLVRPEEVYDFVPVDQVPRYFGGENDVDFRKPPEGTVSYRERLPPDITPEMMAKFFDVYKDIIEDSRKLMQS